MLQFFDGIVLDTEHSLWSDEAIVSSIQVATLMGKKCLIRLHKDDLMRASKVLDYGASGLILSTVESKEEANSFITSSIHRSAGGRRGIGLVRQNMWGMNGLNANLPILIPQIESRLGVERIENITRPEFSHYMIGPYDLSASLESPGDFDNKIFQEYIRRFNEKVKPSQRAIHIPSKIESQINKYRDFNMIFAGMDTTSIVESIQQNVKIIKNFNTDTNQKKFSESSREEF